MIHPYQCNGYHIIIDVNSGSIHSVDEVAYDVISRYETETKEAIIKEMLEKYHDSPDVTEEELNTLFEDIASLKEQGKLFSEDPLKTDNLW